MRNHVGAHLPGLAVRFEFVLWAGQIAGRSLKRDRRSVFQWLPVVLDQFRFVVPSLQLAAGAGAENHQHIFGLSGVMRGTHCVGPGRVDLRAIGQQALFAQQTSERDRPKTGCRLTKKVSAIQEASAMAGNFVDHGMNKNSLLLNNTRQRVARP